MREITKKFEEARRGTLADLAAHYQTEGPKGEIVVVVGPPAEEQADEKTIAHQLRNALQTMSVRDAAAFVAAASGQPKKKIYEMALEITGEK